MPPQKIQALNSLIQVTGVIENAPIKIQQAKVPIHLQIVEFTKPILLLGMDWHKKYQVMTNVSEQILEFTSQRQRYRTIVEYGQEAQVNNLKCFWTEVIDIEEEEAGETEEVLAYLAQIEEEEEIDSF